MGNDCFGAEGGEDSLLTNEELTVGVVSFILWNFDLKKAVSLCLKKALALSLQGAISVCPSAFSYPSHHCVAVIC